MASKLKHCPFCGGVGWLDKATYDPQEEVTCCACGASGPRFSSIAEKGRAVRGWNRRAEGPKPFKKVRASKMTS